MSVQIQNLETFMFESNISSLNHI